jgi:hypothetical protein
MPALSQGGSLGTQIFGLPGSINPTTGQVVGVPASALNQSGISAGIKAAEAKLAGILNPAPGGSLATGGALGSAALNQAATSPGVGSVLGVNPAAAPVAQQPFQVTTGWYVFIGILAAIFLSNTQVGPVILGVEAVALIYQVRLLLEGK